MQKSNSVLCFYCDIEDLGGFYLSWIVADALEMLISWDNWLYFKAFNEAKIRSFFEKKPSLPFIRINNSMKKTDPKTWRSITGIALIPIFIHQDKRVIYTKHLPLRKELYIDFLGLSENEIPQTILLRDFCQLCVLYKKYN